MSEDARWHKNTRGSRAGGIFLLFHNQYCTKEKFDWHGRRKEGLPGRMEGRQAGRLADWRDPLCFSNQFWILLPLVGTTWFFAQYSPNTSNLLPHQKLMATLLMLNKDRGCPPEWEILSIRPTQSTTDGFCWLVLLAAWGHVWSVTDTIHDRQTQNFKLWASKMWEPPICHLLFRELLPTVTLCVYPPVLFFTHKNHQFYETLVLSFMPVGEWNGTSREWLGRKHQKL